MRRAQLLHRAAAADHQRGVGWSRPAVASTLRRLRNQPAPVAGLADRALQRDRVERLFEVVERTVPHRFDGRGHRGMGRDHQHLHAEPAALDLADEFEAVHAGHLQVGDDDVDRPLGQPGERFDGAGAGGDVVAGVAEHVGDAFARARRGRRRPALGTDCRASRNVSCSGSHLLAREFDREGGAAFGAVGRRDRAAVGFGDVVHDGQAQAGAVLLGGVERLEDAALVFFAQAGAAVGDFELEAARAVVRRDHQVAAARASRRPR